MWGIRLSLAVVLASLLLVWVAPAAVAAPASQPAKAQGAAPSKKAPAKVRRAHKAAAKHLDLSLPPEMVKGLDFGQPVAEPGDEPKLPPLFVEKPPEPSAFQLNGKLLTNQKEADYLQSVEGAELQIEFKH